MNLPPQIYPILYAIAAAVIYALAGYFKTQPAETFDKQKFVTTIVIGVLVGVVEVYLNVTFEAAYNLLLSMGLIVVIENVCKIVWRRIFNHPAKAQVLEPLAK